MKIKKLLKLTYCFYLPVLVFLIHKFIFVPLKIYQIYYWADMPMHFLGGCVIAYSCILVLRKVKEEVIINDRFFEILIVVALVGLSAIFWEFYEILMDIIFRTNVNTLKDTMEDFFFGLLGGLTISSLIKIKGDKK